MKFIHYNSFLSVIIVFMAASLVEGRSGVYKAFMLSYGFAAIPKLSRLLPSGTHYPILDGQLHRVSVSPTFRLGSEPRPG